jgi:hypothetical protein
MAIVEAATNPLAVAIQNIDEAARRKPEDWLLDHLLEDPGMAGPPRDLETNLRESVHENVVSFASRARGDLNGNAPR